MSQRERVKEKHICNIRSTENAGMSKSMVWRESRIVVSACLCLWITDTTHYKYSILQKKAFQRGRKNVDGMLFSRFV